MPIAPPPVTLPSSAPDAGLRALELHANGLDSTTAAAAARVEHEMWLVRRWGALIILIAVAALVLTTLPS